MEKSEVAADLGKVVSVPTLLLERLRFSQTPNGGGPSITRKLRFALSFG
jgi:hypothetical protein